MNYLLVAIFLFIITLFYNNKESFGRIDTDAYQIKEEMPSLLEVALVILRPTTDYLLRPLRPEKEEASTENIPLNKCSQ